jgi:hypothetical protein
MGFLAGGFIARPVARSNRAPCTGHEIHPFDKRPHSSLSCACEQIFETAYKRSFDFLIVAERQPAFGAGFAQELRKNYSTLPVRINRSCPHDSA